MTFRRDQIVTVKATGEKVRVIATDSDPRAAVWVVFCTNPDRDAFLLPAELEA